MNAAEAISACMKISIASTNVWLSLGAHNCAIALYKAPSIDPERCEKSIALLQQALMMLNETHDRKAVGRMVRAAEVAAGW